MLYNVLSYLRCSAETAKINLMVFLFMLYCVRVLRSGAEINRFVSQSNTVLETLLLATSTYNFLKQPRSLFKPEIRHILLLLCFFSLKRPPVMITYDCKKTTAQMSQKFSADQTCWKLTMIAIRSEDCNITLIDAKCYLQSFIRSKCYMIWNIIASSLSAYVLSASFSLLGNNFM